MADQIAVQQLPQTGSSSRSIRRFLIVAGVIFALLGSAAIGATSHGIWILAGSMALLVAFVILLRPDVGLYILIIFVFLNLSDVLQQSFGIPSTNKPLVALIFVGVLANRVVLKHKPIIFRGTEIIILGYGMVLLISLLGSRDQAHANKLMIDWVKDYAILLVIVQLSDDEQVWKRMQWALILSAAFAAALSTYQVVTHNYSQTFWGLANAPVHEVTAGFDSQRVTGPLDDPNFYGMIMVMALPLAAYRMLTQRRLLRRAVGAVAFLLIMAVVIFTYSRGAFLAMVIVGLLILRERHFNVYKMGALAVILALIMIPFIPKGFWDRIKTLQDALPSNVNMQTESSFRGRSSEAIVAWEMFRDYPIIGVGNGNYKYLYLQYSSLVGLDNRYEDRQAHSLYLEVLAEEGILGIVVFSSMLIVLFMGLHRAKRLLIQARRPNLLPWVSGVQYGLIGYLLASLFLHGDYIRYFWLIVGFAAATSAMAEELYRRYSFSKTLSVPNFDE